MSRGPWRRRLDFYVRITAGPRSQETRPVWEPRTPLDHRARLELLRGTSIALQTLLET
jgi:hypothetical protein